MGCISSKLNCDERKHSDVLPSIDEHIEQKNKLLLKSMTGKERCQYMINQRKLESNRMSEKEKHDYKQELSKCSDQGVV